MIVLHVDSSLLGSDSVSRVLSREIVEAWTAVAADALVIGVPMYNFSIPTQLKAWIDALSRAGRTFAYTPDGPCGFAGDKRVVLASSRGNVYDTPATKEKEFHESYLTTVLRFMGLTRFEVFRAEGVNRSLAMREAALVQARAAIPRLFATPAVEAQ